MLSSEAFVLLPEIRDPLENIEIVLASASPRRSELLARVGFIFQVEPANIDESQIRDRDPIHLTRLIARAKAEKIHRAGNLTISADTIVVLDDQVLEKPHHSQEAVTMLSSLSGRTHSVITNVAVGFPDGGIDNFFEKTEVTFSKISQTVISAYIATQAPFDKAGGYGAQDSFGLSYIKKISGCYFNALGLPVQSLMGFLSANQKRLHH